ncbi:hypothetical protein CRE_18344, partial [Caenorhabditis remanei]
LVHQLTEKSCKFFTIQDVRNVKILNSSSNKKVAFKISLPTGTCPRDTEAPPLFGNDSSSLIITDGEGTYYKSEVTYSPETWDYTEEINIETWDFNYGMLNCLTDIPENYVPLDITEEYPYYHELTSPFSPGETFFMRGKTAKLGKVTTIAFLNTETSDYPLYIILNQEHDVSNNVSITIRKNNNQLLRNIPEIYPNPYGPEEDFEIRVTSTKDVATIYFNTTKIEYPLYSGVPLPNINYFVINYNGESQPNQRGELYFLGWTGDCQYLNM